MVNPSLPGDESGRERPKPWNIQQNLMTGGAARAMFLIAFCVPRPFPAKLNPNSAICFTDHQLAS
ncbi:hypothetical protein SAMN05519103_07672 [Rhizobiales bacterium GAS113]|nr:hypothetical protein SAMN05519103_07672 [Rhizobiales bacterium GAS113]